MSWRNSVLACLMALAMCSSSFAAAPRPNFLIILADDLGYGDMQANNPQRGKIPTPHMDALAAQGMRFTDGHTSSGCCSPTRYTLLTGRYHWRSRLQQGIVQVWGAPLVAPDRLTIGRLAQQHGYRTACVGKWHLGRDWPIADQQRPFFEGFGGGRGGGAKVVTELTDAHREVWRKVFSQPIPGGPTTRGFDEYFGTDVPNWPPYCFIENDRTVGIPTELLPAAKLVKNQASLQGPALKDWQLESILPALAERASDFIAKQTKAEQPFLLYLPLTAPHTPISPNQAWRGKSAIGHAYADFVMETDATIGRVLKALDDSGAADNTFVLFTSDNGCARYIGVEELEARGHFPSGPLRDYKASVYEGGHRVPFVVRWPGVVQLGSVCGQLVHQADLLATMEEILDTTLPENAGEDSVSFLPLLKGQDQPVRTHAVSCACDGTPSLRQGPWKLVFAADEEAQTPVQLYNLDSDLGETKNVAATQPKLVAELRELMEQSIVEGRTTPGARQKNDVKVRRYPRPKPAAKKANAE
ncbi:MAG: arylsulfatase [Pirellulales bacterium]